jgi:hypothetical protein
MPVRIGAPSGRELRRQARPGLERERGLRPPAPVQPELELNPVGVVIAHLGSQRALGGRRSS